MKLTKISRKKRSGKHGYRARKATPGGRKVLKRRQARGRKRINVKSVK